MSKKFPVKETAKVAVICLLSSAPFIGTFLTPLKLNVYFPGETQDSGLWSKLTTRGVGTSCSKVAVELS